MAATSNTDPLVSILLQSISRKVITPDGRTEMQYDPEQLRYRMMSVHSNNFVAFVRRYRDCLSVCKDLAATQLPGVGDALAAYFSERVETMMVSTTAESSHDAELIRLILQDRKEIAYLESQPKSPGVLDRIANATQPPAQGTPQPQS